MRIKKIEKLIGIYYVTFEPNFIERIFGVKEKVEKYKHTGYSFTLFPSLMAFCHSSGKLLSWDDKTLEALNEFERKF